MSILLQRVFLAAFLASAPGLVLAASDPEEKKEEISTEAPAEAKAEGDEASAAKPDDDEINAVQKAIAAQDKEWAEKLRKRHHEGDVALGVCGGRLTALMWFYQSSVADGRDDLESALEALTESRTILKQEAERRAVEDGVGTSVSVMNEHSADLWKGLIEASDKPDTFQEAHDGLFADVQECLSLFFKRPGSAAAEEPVGGDAADGEGEPDEKSD